MVIPAKTGLHAAAALLPGMSVETALDATEFDGTTDPGQLRDDGKA